MAQTRGARSASLRPPDATLLAGQGVTDAGAPLMDPVALRKLARLPGTARELVAVQTMLGASVNAIRLVGNMTEPALRETDLSAVSTLHLATHGLTASESGARAEPGLVFTPPAKATNKDDGYLAVSEVLELDLRSTEWVILSACNTAAPSGKAGEAGLSGLARAFFYAGAPSLLVSHWPVYDSVAAELTVNALRRTQIGESRAKALQNAMRDIRNTNDKLEFAHPGAWAAFTLAGEGR
ncbi:CHAT domain-containing protein [Blastomonas sp.]|uniref:CHAT domain-containing protein n=1 Tax=Blastomonas sp. TaxID=1909299 RepID=UPI0035939FA6